MARLLQIFSRRPGGGLPNSATFLTGGDGPQIYLRQSFSSYWRGLCTQYGQRRSANPCWPGVPFLLFPARKVIGGGL